MKKLMLLTSVLCSGCIGVGGGVQQNNEAQAQPVRQIIMPITYMPKGTAVGEITEYNAQTAYSLKSVVSKAGCLDEYLNVYNADGSLRTSTPLVTCVPNGVSKGYSAKGTLKTEIPIKDGMAEGPVKLYAPNGVLAREEMYHQGFPSDYKKAITAEQALKLGDEVLIARLLVALGGKKASGTEFNITVGDVNYRAPIKNGCFDQYFRSYYSNGKLKQDYPVQNCKANGIAKTYSQQGDLVSEIPFVDNFAHGVAKEYGSTEMLEVTYEQGYMVKMVIYAQQR